MPRFKTVQDEGEFWDTHDTTEFEDEFKEVRVKTVRPLDHILAVRLEAETITQLAKIAERLGIGPSTLVRMWLLERLHQLEGEGESRGSQTEVPHPASKA